ncbi:MAG: site-specific integrase [Candidatus Pedobacter colombiensis]|uniref:Site-specific integrase n=1 Tax=Candidatus Pedobacter colombiensis TaxID=3121371 RepID=A0AAJ5W4M3_9SPHI|nr:site-specific integrase [Pedobacter sp.]WEK17887.1 MAG: site-specific integrase [Pedobacter sp.]
MKSTHTFSLSFFLRKDKAKNGKAPLFARITVDGAFTDISTKQRVDILTWNQGKQTLSGNGAEELMVREKMRLLINNLNNAYNDLRHENKAVNAELIKARVEGRDKDLCSLNFLMNYHNVELASLLEPGTLKNYFSTERYLQEFLVKKRKMKDIYLDSIDNKFITDFGIYMLNRVPDKGQKPCGNNTLMKHMERFKKVFGVALKNGWTMNQPFLHFERKIIHKDRDCLEIEELNRIRDVDGLKSSEIITRDLFVFSCLTGLAYCDLVSLAEKHLVKDSAGENWIEMIRQKNRNFTERKFHVLLLPEALEIIKRYKNHQFVKESGTIFPFVSNQLVNRHLKIIAKAANINKVITFHWARHTFATTVTLENGVPMESVSHMLGHASIRTTQIYSKVKRKKVLNDMTELRNKISVHLLKVL